MFAHFEGATLRRRGEDDQAGVPVPQTNAIFEFRFSNFDFPVSSFQFLNEEK